MMYFILYLALGASLLYGKVVEWVARAIVEAEKDEQYNGQCMKGGVDYSGQI